MIVILEAQITRGGKSIGPRIPINRLVKRTEVDKYRREMEKEYLKLGISEVEIWFSTMEIPQNVNKNLPEPLTKD